MPRVTAFGIGVSMVVLLARTAAAHDTWLLPAADRCEAGSTLALVLTSGMVFPSNESAIDPARIESARLRLVGQDVDLVVVKRETSSLALAAVPRKAGLGTLWVELRPRTLELKPNEVEEYLLEVGAPAEVARRWQASPSPHRWRESYRKHAKAFVLVGRSPSGDLSWAEPVGAVLELVPDQDPTRLKTGDTLSVHLLRNGAPAVGLGVGLVGGGSNHAEMQTTDAGGRVAFDLSRPGKWLLRATDLRPSTTEGIDWESDFATLTLSVR